MEAVRQASGWSFDSSADEDRNADATVTARLRSLRELAVLCLRDVQVFTPPARHPEGDWECVGTWELCWRDGTIEALEVGKYPGQQREDRSHRMINRFRDALSIESPPE